MSGQNAPARGAKSPPGLDLMRMMEIAIVPTDTSVDWISDQQCVGKRIRQMSFKVSTGRAGLRLMIAALVQTRHRNDAGTGHRG